MLHKFPVVVFSCVLACTAGLSGQTPSYTGGTAARPMIAGPIDESRLTVLEGNTNPHATAANDRGAVEQGLRLDHMQLVLQRPAELESQLETLMAAQQDKNSPQYHKWLTAAAFGKKYGVSSSDVERVSNWLTAQGFRVESVLPSGMAINFSGTAGQVKQAFHTEIHTLDVDGVKHISNMSDPKIPEALAAVVKGVHSLNDFMPHTMYKKRAKETDGGGVFGVGPSDLATIYNLNPAFQAGFTGSGQTVVVIEDTDVFSAADIAGFRSTFGLSSYSGTFTQTQPSGSNACGDPGVVPGNEAEAELDAEWAGASAPNAAVVLASCTDTNTVFGGLLALQNLINGTSIPQIVSISYGECEAENGATANLSYSTAYQQAAAEGVSVFVSSGDEGAASCDANRNSATHGIATSGFATTPFNVAVGGTDYAETFLGDASTYLSKTNSATYGSALSYIPEIPWNDSCGSQLFAVYLGFANTYGAGGLCNSSMAVNDGLLTTGSGSGGPSNCYSGASGHVGVSDGTCAGQPKPSWQSALGVPADGVRDIPDVSLFAANGYWGNYFIYCDSDVSAGGTACSGDPAGWSGAGGTSFSSPILAGMQALINQAHEPSGTGNPNPRYYALGSLEFGTSGSSACNSALGNGVGSTCVFYDVTLGDMDINCTGSNNCYRPSGTNGVLSTSNTAYDLAYGTQSGWDFATGLGTVNAWNLIQDWSLIQTATAVTSAPSTPATSETVTYMARLKPGIGATQTGRINWSANTGCAPSQASGSGVATCAVNWSAGGSQTVTATYTGDKNYATSAGSLAQQVITSAVLTAPANGSAFSSSSATFTWSAATGAVSYGIWIGSTGVGSNNIWGSGATTATSVSFSALPTNGNPIYVRLFTTYASGTAHNDYTFTAATAAVLSAPAAGVLPGPVVTFSWPAVGGATGYDVWIGSTGVGSNNIWGSGLITATSVTFSQMPTSGGTINVRLFTKLATQTVHNDYTFTAATQAAMISPAPNSTFTGKTATFTWTASPGSDAYDMWIGTHGVGSNNIWGTGAISATSATFWALPTDGQPVYIRLFTRFGTTLVHYDYVYTAAP